ncbi:Mechanosensitive ion channel-domain-containing protein [Phellopilus nigrolimitatus]|nr:Mechanosensitive ion channel-domain-containing protein [Phellopilus nigrolimitatus]
MSARVSKEVTAGLEMSSLSSKSDSQSPINLKIHDYKSEDPSVTFNEIINKSAANDSPSDTETNSSDEFDWEAEDDGVDTKDLETKRKTRRGRKIYGLFMKLSRPIRTFLVAVLGAGVLITPLLVTHFRFHDSPARPHVHAWSLWLSISWAAASATYLVVDLIPRFVVFIVTLFRGQVENLKTQLELVYAVSGWLKLTLDVSWSWIALSVVRAALHPPGSYWVIINRVIQALFAASLILLVEKLFLRFVAIRFHQKALADRLAENKLALKALDRLSNAQPVATKKMPYLLNRKKGHKSSLGGSRSASMDMLNKELCMEPVPPEDAAGDLQGGKQSAMGRKRRRKAVAAMIVDQLGDAIGQVALKDSKFNRGGEITGLHSARRLARQLFASLSNVHPARDYLIVEDFYPYFRSTAEATAAFAVFDKDDNGDITKKEMREAVQRIYRERKALISSLKDVGSAVAKLDAVLVTVALLGIIFCCLLIFNRGNTVASLVPLATIVLGFSFIFGNSAQTLFESLIFIFSTHVFDVGDLVLIDDQPLFVREFGLFSTTFRRVDGQEIIAPNSLLASTKLVHNLRRSNSMWETTNIMVSYDTPLEAIETLQSRLKTYVSQNNREWSNVLVNIDKMEYQNAITLVIAMEHRPNWQDWGGRWARRTLFMRNLKVVLEELDITYTLPIQPVLLPKYPPYGNNQLDVPSRQVSQSSMFGQSRESLGNAGFHQDEVYRAPGPGPTFRIGGANF